MPVKIYSYEQDHTLRILEGIQSIPSLDDVEVLWIDIESDDSDELQEIAAQFSFHELTIEDCLTPSHFPKLEDYGSYLFMIFRGLRPTQTIDERRNALREAEEAGRALTPEEEDEDIFTHKVAIYLSKKFVVTFRRTEVSWLDAVARQVRNQPELTIGMGTDVLAHRIIDVLTDRFLRGLGYFDTLIDGLEDQLLEDPDDFDISNTLDLKRDLGSLRQVMRDQRGIISRLVQEAALVRGRDYRRYFKDVEDHALTIVNSIDKLIENVLGIRDAYFALSNVRLGDTMRVLTLITTIVAPLNLVVGLYGMNFEAIPLLHNPYGFWLIVISMLLLVAVMVIYFKRRRWL